MSRKHICITGKDGAGKSTVINNLKGSIESCYIANIWDLLENQVKGIPFKSKGAVDDFLCGLTPDSRLLFLAHAMKYSIDKAFESNKDVIFSDGYYYKYFATELVLGADVNLVRSLMQSFPEPDLVIELDLSLEESIIRKQHFSRYECGLTKKPNGNQFFRFQSKVEKAWNDFNIKNKYIISSIGNEEDTIKSVLKIINSKYEDYINHGT